ncbi:MAG: beta galactosidase jelly roll domain-containing protein [Saprospiraceae bacterium]|nr:beta galactosidase jelly roll domain-containing protein [Saprospiraceae bacterium]
MRFEQSYKIIILALLLLDSCSYQNSPLIREISFNVGWKFFRTEVIDGQSPALDDSNWRIIDLPHDYSIEDLTDQQEVRQIGPFSQLSAGGPSTGHVEGGVAWYRKHFSLAEKDRDHQISVLFDGVYMNADVWINGNHLGNHPYGYTAFVFDLTKYLHPPGQENILAVEVKNEGKKFSLVFWIRYLPRRHTD